MRSLAVEWLKEYFRVIALAVIPVLIAELERGEINWQMIIVVALIAALRATEKSLHENDKVSLPF